MYIVPGKCIPHSIGTEGHSNCYPSPPPPPRLPISLLRGQHILTLLLNPGSELSFQRMTTPKKTTGSGGVLLRIAKEHGKGVGRRSPVCPGDVTGGFWGLRRWQAVSLVLHTRHITKAQLEKGPLSKENWAVYISGWRYEGFFFSFFFFFWQVKRTDRSREF